MKMLEGVFQEYLQYHEWEKQSRPQTIRWHKVCMRPFVQYLCEWESIREAKLQDFNVEHIRKFFISRLKFGISPRTNLSCWQSLRAFSNFLLEREYVTKDPMLNISRPRVEKKLPDALNTDQVKELMRFMLSCRKRRYRISYLRNLALVSIFVYAGLRRNEALCLKVNDVDFENNVIRLTFTKTRRQEQVPMCSSLKTILLNYVKVRMTLKRNTDSFFICSNRSGYDTGRGNGSFGTRGIQLLFEEINAEVGAKIGKRLTPHLLRRSFATMLLRKGSNIVQVSRLLRHKDISTTVRSYIGYDESELMQAVEKFHPLNIKF